MSESINLNKRSRLNVMAMYRSTRAGRASRWLIPLAELSSPPHDWYEEEQNVSVYDPST